MNLETIVFENNTLHIIDQSLLPDRFEYLKLTTLEETLSAIKKLKVRGAPAIGIVAAYGLYIHALNLSQSRSLNKSSFLQAGYTLKSARPTAVNLSWAVDKMVQVFLSSQIKNSDSLLIHLKQEAEAIHQSDKKTCDLIGKYGAELLPDPVSVLTHCNAGILATGGRGTALSVIYTAQKKRAVQVFVDETRPVGQGIRLTYWELKRNNIPVTVLTDNMAGMLMQQNKIDVVIVGADRIAKNGDTANKIGTYSLAVLANYHHIPFYVAAPLSSFDMTLEDGKAIPIEYRAKNEILDFWNITDQTAFEVFNPAFDVTPHKLISGIITEKGVIKQPNKTNLPNLFTN